MQLRIVPLVALFALAVIPSRSAPQHVPAAMLMEATAFSKALRPTSAGTIAHEGIVAADPAVLPLGSRIRITRAGAWSGIYTVTDTGAKIQGRHIDLYIPSVAAARRFGKRTVRVQLLETGTGKQDARDKDIPAVR